MKMSVKSGKPTQLVWTYFPYLSKRRNPSQLSSCNDSDSEDTMVEEDSDSEASSDESSSSEVCEEAEWYHRVCEAANAFATTRSASPDLAGNRPAARTPTGTFRNVTTMEESSRLLNDTTRITSEDVPAAPMNPSSEVSGRRSPSVEIIGHYNTERARRERQREYIQGALEREGFVCTGYRVP